jgi:hypothetical protein
MSRFAEVDRLFARHGLGPVTTVQPLPGGRLNHAVRVNATHVLRWRDPSRATGSLKREVGVLKRLGGRVPAPEVVASGLDEMLGEYVVQHYIPGENLLYAWLENPDVATREWWLMEWVAAIRGIHSERFPRPGEWSNGELKEASSGASGSGWTC